MWFTETPWPPVFICVAAVILLGVAWKQNGRKAFLYAAIGLLLACPAIIAFEKWYITEPEEVEQAVYDLAKAVEAGEVEKAVGFISKDRFVIRTEVRKGMSLVEFDGTIRVTDVHAASAADGQSVLSRFRANADVIVKSGGGKHHIATMWELTWKKIDGNWQITEIQRLDPLKESKIGLLDPPGQPGQ